MNEETLIRHNLDEQELYQRCVRGSNHKLISHDGEVVMNRLLQALEPGVKGLFKRSLQRVSSWAQWFRNDFPKPINRLFWVNYEEDPEEMQVHP